MKSFLFARNFSFNVYGIPFLRFLSISSIYSEISLSVFLSKIAPNSLSDISKASSIAAIVVPDGFDLPDAKSINVPLRSPELDPSLP